MAQSEGFIYWGTCFVLVRYMRLFVQKLKELSVRNKNNPFYWIYDIYCLVFQEFIK